MGEYIREEFHVQHNVTRVWTREDTNGNEHDMTVAIVTALSHMHYQGKKRRLQAWYPVK